MTFREIYLQMTEQFKKAGCEDPAFDAYCLLEDIGGLSHGRIPGDDLVPKETVRSLLTAVDRRCNGEPLQYILGKWDFLSLTLEVGKGVLIPRPDTELLCEIAAQKLKNKQAVSLLDLCAGSGCVGLGVCSLLKNAQATEVELSEKAFAYLQRNIARYPQYSVQAIKDDVCAPKKAYPLADAILSNPPYIPSGDLPTLMREVQFEPMLALDGDCDGLRFYRAILKNWLPYLKGEGLLAVEVGVGQAAQVRSLFDKAGLSEIEIFRDLGGIERVVCGVKPA